MLESESPAARRVGTGAMAPGEVGARHSGVLIAGGC